MTRSFYMVLRYGRSIDGFLSLLCPFCVLGLRGSHAYGTSNENSDIDLRGVTLQMPSDLIGMTEFEQFEDRETDTVIYGFNKIVKLLLDCNPNTCEILGLDEDQYLIKSDLGQEMIDNAGIFLSKRAIKSFGVLLSPRSGSYFP